MRLKGTIKNYITVLCLIIILAIPKIISAQVQPNYVQFQTESGLQSNTIYNLSISKTGLLYIAHSKGLSSFDGNSFVNVYHKERPFTEVSNIMETDDGQIFCRAFNNVLFRKIGDSLRWFVSIVPYSYGFAPSAAFKNEVYSITNDSVIIYDAAQNKKSTIPLSSSKPLSIKQNIKFICWSKFKGEPTLFIVNEKKEIYHFNIAPGAFHFNNNELFFVQNKSVGKFYYYTKNENVTINNFKKATINYISSTDSIIWVCTTNGIYYRNKFDKSASFNYILTGYDVSDVKQTKEGNFFISTLGQGLLFVPNFNVNKIYNVPKNITTISGYSNNILLGTKENGVVEQNLETGKNKKLSTIENSSSIKLIYKKDIKSPVFITSNSSYINNKKYLFSIKDYCEIDGNILLATDNGIFLYEKIKNNHWVNKYIIPSKQGDEHVKKLSFSNEHTSSIKYNSKNDKIYISNYTGLLEMANGYKDYIKLPEPDCVLKDITIWNNELLLATKDKGLLKWNGLKYESAFPKKQTTGILYKFEIYKNELWILGEEAIFCYKNNSLITYNNQLGINAENIRGLYITEKKVYANSGNSIIEFAKDIKTNNSSKAQFILNKVINVNANKTINQQAVLSHTENFISFQFSLISFANAANTHIAYSINNQDIVHLPSNRREINLDFLKAENYNIEFYIVENGITPLQPISNFTFVIKPAFYNSWWFLTIMLLLISYLVYYFSKRKIEKERAALLLKESRILLEKELDKTTLSSIKAQMNPHFIFNALNTIQSYIYMNDKKNASVYISKFSDLTRSILDMSTRETISVNEEINALDIYLSLEKMRFEDSFEYSINADDSIEKDKVQLPSMLLQPYVENAVKHGLLHRKTNRILNINFTTENYYLKIIIDDNGIGRKKSEELKKINSKNHNSFAMSANKKRLEILKQQHKEIYLNIIDKYDNNNESLGTQVIIKLPL